MSHDDAHEGFGASIINSTENGSSNRSNLFYKVFYQNSKESNVDGIVIGGNRLDILKEFSFKKELPIYSPGLITQGGNIKSALNYGADFLIIGRAILNSNDPLSELKGIYNIIKGSTFK
jgi:orotidine-5'-phosphate decarboxylase